MCFAFEDGFRLNRLKVVYNSGDGCSMAYWLCRLNILSDAQLDTLRKIPQKFQINSSCCLGGVVVTRFGDLLRNRLGVIID